MLTATRLRRLPNWRVYLDAVLHARRRAPFAWGSNDCAIFAADCVRAQTGVDLADGLRGQNARQAIRTVRRHGGIAALATRALGPACDARWASLGDVVLLYAGKREALGVCIGDGELVGPGPAGLALLPMSAALAAWRVG